MLPELNIGDKVLLRRYKDILCEYEQLEDGCIGTYGYFHKRYKYLCGKEQTVARQVSAKAYGFFIKNSNWWFHKDLFDW